MKIGFSILKTKSFGCVCLFGGAQISLNRPSAFTENTGINVGAEPLPVKNPKQVQEPKLRLIQPERRVLPPAGGELIIPPMHKWAKHFYGSPDRFWCVVSQVVGLFATGFVDLRQETHFLDTNVPEGLAEIFL